MSNAKQKFSSGSSGRVQQPVKDLLASLIDNIFECPSNHPFLVANGIESAQCLTYSGDTEISGVDLNGSVVAKIYDIHGEFVNALFKVQVHDGTFEDILIPGAPIAGCYARFGKLGQTYLVVEDIRCAIAMNLATGMGVVVAINRENLLSVCQALVTKYPDKTMIVCGGDNGNMAGRRSTDAFNTVARKVGVTPHANFDTRTHAIAG